MTKKTVEQDENIHALKFVQSIRQMGVRKISPNDYYRFLTGLPWYVEQEMIDLGDALGIAADKQVWVRDEFKSQAAIDARIRKRSAIFQKLPGNGLLKIIRAEPFRAHGYVVPKKIATFASNPKFTYKASVSIAEPKMVWLYVDDWVIKVSREDFTIDDRHPSDIVLSKIKNKIQHRRK